MLIPLALFVGLLLATAFIAHWSDNLGKKLGKKRVSVFGLRPRTSATILTIVSSWVIMSVTLLALLGTVRPLRNALFRYESDRDSAIEQVQTLQEQAKIAVADKNAAQADRNAALQQKQIALVSAQTAQTDLQTAKYQAAGFQKQAATSQKQQQSAQRNFQIAGRAAQAAQKRQRQAVDALAGAQKALGTSQNQLTRTQSDLARGRSQVARAKGDLDKANSDLRAKQQQIQTARENLQKAKQDLGLAKAATLRVKALALRIGPKIVKLQQQADSLKIQIATATNIALGQAEIADQMSEYALSDIRLPVDQTLAERRIDAGQTPAQVERELRILLEASQKATREMVPGATLTARSIVPDPQTKTLLQLDETQSVQLYARLLSAANQSVSVRLASAANYPLGSKEVLARFVPVPIRIIYSARERIAQATVDTSNKSEAALWGQLQRLVDDARYNAVKKGASPPLSPEEKNFFDGDTGQKQFDALHQIQRIGHPVTVRIVAARDLDAAEPLQVRFVVGESA